MGASNGDDGQQESQQEGQTAPLDLIDFYLRWRSEFRETAILLSRRADLSPSEQRTVHWMILLLDRVSRHDLEAAETPD
jgi:hypothetical protein